MSRLIRNRKLLVLATPFVVSIATLAGLILAGSDATSDAQTTTGGRRSYLAQAGNASHSQQAAQTGASYANGAQAELPVGPVPVTAKSELKIYRCPPGQAEAVAGRLQQEFGRNPGVRVVPDRRTSQVLVMAPPEIQVQIGNRLGSNPVAVEDAGPPSAKPAPPQPQPPRAPAMGGPRSSQEVQLWNTSGQEFEAAMVRTLGHRLLPVPSAQRDLSAYQLRLNSGQVLGVAINRRTNRVRVDGPAVAVGSAMHLVHALDGPEQPAQQSMELLSIGAARRADIQRTVDAIQTAQAGPGPRGSQVSMVVQAPGQAGPAPAGAADGQPPAAPNGTGAAADQAAEPPAEGAGLIGPVQIEMLEGLDVLVIRGHQRDVEQVVKIIEQIEKLVEVELAIEIVHLRHVHCVSLAALLSQLYEDVFSLRQGDVSITALVKPNAILLVGRRENVDMVKGLIERLDQPVPPSTQFRVFRLKHTPVEEARTTIEEFFETEDEEEAGGLAPRVQVTIDFRSNSLIVRASPSDMAQVEAMIARIDTGDSEAFNEVRVFKLQNSLAEDLAQVLQDAITGQMYGQRAAQRIGAIGAQRQDYERKSIRLQFLAVDPRGKRLLSSGILTDVQVTADARQNALVVTASPDSMPLIAALIKELDGLPTAVAEVKVFTLYYSDATNMVDVLEALFGEPAAAGEAAVRTGATEGESSLVPLRFAADVRTNSIIASGSLGDLSVVDAILLRLDESDLRRRQTVVFRLKNASAANVAEAVSDFLSSELEAQQPVQGLLSSVEQIAREVVVVPEEFTNSLIISATEPFFQQVIDLVEEIDARPPMVVIQVLMAVVSLTDADEFGVELGLQDSILFDRSVVGTGTSIPGFLFNSTQDLGNSNSADALAKSNIVGSQGITNFGVGRFNSELGTAGLVVSASSEAVSVLIRALKEQRRLEVLERPQIMTLDNVPAVIQVGERVPVVQSVTPATGLQAQTFTTQPTDVGVLLNVTPRVTPEGLIIMEIVATRSEVGPEEEGIPVSIATTGEVLRSPRIEIVEAQTAISAMDGHTVILGGLITRGKRRVRRQVPWLGDLPVLGHLFRHHFDLIEKEELLIILTPHIVRNEEDAERIKQIESARMNWCLSDVFEVHGGDGLRARDGEWEEWGTDVIYPDLDPAAETIQTPTKAGDHLPPTDAETPFRLELPPPEPEEGSATVPHPAPTPEAPRPAAPQPPGGAASSVQPAAYEAALALVHKGSETSPVAWRGPAVVQATSPLSQEAATPAIFTRDPSFSIPFRIDAAENPARDAAEVHLYVSSDGGQTWQFCDRVKPEQEQFLFRAPGDGEYWFQIRTLDRSGRLRADRGDRPGLRIVVDTTVPVLQLLPGPIGGSQRSVHWRASDPYLDLPSLTLEYRRAEGGPWRPLAGDPQSICTAGLWQTGEAAWPMKPGDHAGPVEVRARVADAVGNWAVSHATIPAADRAP